MKISYSKTMRAIYALATIAVTVFFYQDIMPGGKIFNIFDTGDIGYVFFGPIFAIAIIWLISYFMISTLDSLLFKSNFKQWMNSY